MLLFWSGAHRICARDPSGGHEILASLRVTCDAHSASHVHVLMHCLVCRPASWRCPSCRRSTRRWCSGGGARRVSGAAGYAAVGSEAGRVALMVVGQTGRRRSQRSGRQLDCSSIGTLMPCCRRRGGPLPGLLHHKGGPGAAGAGGAGGAGRAACGLCACCARHNRCLAVWVSALLLNTPVQQWGKKQSPDAHTAAHSHA